MMWYRYAIVISCTIVTNDEMNIQFDKLIVTHELAIYMKIFTIMKSIMFTSTLCFLYILTKDIHRVLQRNKKL